jgi:carbohydrate kinase (thermoresistant glucokinase family)
MGVSGAGKSTVGQALAEELRIPFLDGDDLHTAVNIARMAAGNPLDDDDRWPWLDRVGEALSHANAAGTGLVIACSALKRAYRDRIRDHAPSAFFVLLNGPREVLLRHTQDRDGHFMPSSLLDSQLNTLEPLSSEESGATIDVRAPVSEIVRLAASSLRF